MELTNFVMLKNDFQACIFKKLFNCLKKIYFKILNKFLCFVPVEVNMWKLSQSMNKPKPHVIEK